MLQMSNANDVILLPGQQSEDFLQEAIPLDVLDSEFIEVIPLPEAQVELSETLEPFVFQETEELIEAEINKNSLFTKKFLWIIGSTALCAVAFPIFMGIGERSQISQALECQKVQQIRANQSSIETLQARFRALGVEPPAVSIETTSLSACGPGE
jgi:hypothetical protein